MHAQYYYPGLDKGSGNADTGQKYLGDAYGVPDYDAADQQHGNIFELTGLVKKCCPFPALSDLAVYLFQGLLILVELVLKGCNFSRCRSRTLKVSYLLLYLWYFY